MSETKICEGKKRFTFSNTYRWTIDGFLGVMNGLDTKLCKLKKRIKQQDELISEQAIQLDYLQAENQHMKDVLETNVWLKKSLKRQQSSNEECSKYIKEVVKENEQLKSTIMEMEDYLGRLEEQLDYIQNSITLKLLNQKTKIGEKALKEVVQDYNEWMLGHK